MSPIRNLEKPLFPSSHYIKNDCEFLQSYEILIKRGRNRLLFPYSVGILSFFLYICTVKKRLIGQLIILPAILLMVVVTGCSERQEHRDALHRALSLMDNHPDSALSVLDSLGKHKADFGHHFSMQYRLHRLNAYNKLDTVFRSTDEANQLVTYFEDNGTPNEQMLANYLLGRAYYDLHEAPQALRYYQIAVERADTTADDCNYRQLSRVYGQMATLFYYQNLMERSLQCDDKSIEYGFKGKDTLNAILSMTGKIAPFYDLLKVDSAISVGEQASNLAKLHGYRNLSAAILGGIIGKIVEKGDISKAKHFLDIYESESGYFDSNNDIEKGMETYYYVKGLYYLNKGNFDSSEYFFRKELKEGIDFNNQNAGSRGLALVYQKKQVPDSAAKYALYSYAMNDSAYAQMATDKVEQMQALYDYSRHQEIAQQEQHRADQEHERLLWIVFMLILVAMISASLIRKERRKRKEVRDKYDGMVSTLAQTQSDVLMLRSHETELSQMIREKEEKIDQLNEAIFSYQDKVGAQKESAESLLLESPDYKEISIKGARGVVLSEPDWQHIYILLINTLPNFYKFISSKKFELNDKEFKTCILIRLHLPPGDIAKMLDVSPAYITKIRNSMMKKLFGIDGKSKELDTMLMDFS